MVKNGVRISNILFLVATLLVFIGYYAEMWALEAGNQLVINLAPDIFGSGLLVFVFGLVMRLLGKKLKV